MATIRWLPMGTEYWCPVCELRICFWLQDHRDTRCSECGVALIYVGLVERADLGELDDA